MLSDIENECLYFSINKLQRVINKIADKKFKKIGLSTSYAMLVLKIKEKNKLTHLQISDELKLDASTITRHVEKLENMDILKKTRLGREIFVELTQDSKEIVEKIENVQLDLQNHYKEILGDEAIFKNFIGSVNSINDFFYKKED